MPKVKKTNSNTKKKVDAVAEPAIIDDKLIEAEIPETEEVEAVVEAEDLITEDDEELETLGENWDE